tara:strand:+ start:838 stop:1371 length:534 start_codon:yes stop_codon:yes gene_type:complete
MKHISSRKQEEIKSINNTFGTNDSTYCENTFQFPLCILNHIRHLNNNFILKKCDIILPVEKFNDQSLGCSEFNYVINRLNLDKSLVLENGWRLLPLSDINTSYYKSKNIWKTSNVCFYKYMGMGNINVLAFDHESKQYFLFPEGGSNGYEQQYSYTSATALTSDTINVVNIYNLFNF